MLFFAKNKQEKEPTVRFVSKLSATQSSPIARAPVLRRHLVEFGLCFQGSGNEPPVCVSRHGGSLWCQHITSCCCNLQRTAKEPTAGLGVPLCRYDGGSSWSASYQGEGLACSGEFANGANPPVCRLAKRHNHDIGSITGPSWEKRRHKRTASASAAP